MSDEDEAIDQDDEDELDADGADATSAVAESEADDEEVVAAPAGRAARELPEAHSVAARAAIRNSLAADVEAFLARGGSIHKVADDQHAEPQKKPESNHERG